LTSSFIDRVTRRATLAAILLTALVLIYVPDVGHGFVKDDYVWIARSRLESLADVAQLLQAPTGFFRPLVSASFGVNRALSPLNPLGYGLTNLGLLIGCCLSIAWLVRALSFPWPSAVFAAALWAFNFHGINAAVLWISGRTALLLTLFATLGAQQFIRERYLFAGVMFLLAMLSKEEAVVVPGILLVWSTVADRWTNVAARYDRRIPTPVIALAAPVLIYFLLRVRSGAFTPATAPPYYQLSFTLERLLSQVAPYADRSMTFSAVVLLVLAAVGGVRRLELSYAERSAMVFGFLWLVGGFALTVFLPVRSSLYVCFPSVGVVVVAAALATAAWRTMTSRRQAIAVLVGLSVPFLLWPVYHVRNSRLVSEADLSSATLAEIGRVAGGSPRPLQVILRDDRSARPSLNDAFGTMVQEAVDLVIGPDVHVWIDPPPTGAELAGLSTPPEPDVALRLRDGAVSVVVEADQKK
jgi:hypothetical protein